jgi:hypothetical protein
MAALETGVHPPTQSMEAWYVLRVGVAPCLQQSLLPCDIGGVSDGTSTRDSLVTILSGLGHLSSLSQGTSPYRW